MTVLVLVRDLLFASKIAATARAQNVETRILRDPAMLAGERESRVIVDLNQAGAIEAAGEWKARTGGTVIGFVSHVDSETIQRAREAGLDQIMTRSAFVESLASLLAG